MDHLVSLDASSRESTRRGFIDIDLFQNDGTFVSLACPAEHARSVTSHTHCNLLQVRWEGGCAKAGLLVGWPRPLRPGSLIVHAVEPGDHVVVHSRVQLRSMPSTVISGEAALEPRSPWIQVMGPAGTVSQPLYARAPRKGKSQVVYARDVLLPNGCELVSPGDQVLFMVTVGAETSAVR